MTTYKELIKYNDISTLRRIAMNKNLGFSYSLFDFLISGKYNSEVDFDVYLTSKGFNLQRPYVWTPQQQEEFIWSLIYERYIPPVTFVLHEVDDCSRLGHQIYKVIDGKQRLMTIKRFMLNEFPIHFEGTPVYWDDLDNIARSHISNIPCFSYNVYYSYEDLPVTDDELITIFNFYNFAGTPQEEKHREKLINALNR